MPKKNIALPPKLEPATKTRSRSASPAARLLGLGLRKLTVPSIFNYFLTNSFALEAQRVERSTLVLVLALRAVICQVKSEQRRFVKYAIHPSLP